MSFLLCVKFLSTCFICAFCFNGLCSSRVQKCRNPWLHCMGADTATVLSWLASKCVMAEEMPESLDLVIAAVWSADVWMRVLMKGGEFLEEPEWQTASTVGRYFIAVYFTLAESAAQSGELLWHIRPKLHLLCHLAWMDKASKQNPGNHTTFMDEDFMKQFMRIKRATHVVKSSLRVLQRYLESVKLKLGRMPRN